MQDFSIKVLDVVENEDGSAIVTIDMDDNARNALIEQGFISILKAAIAATKAEIEKGNNR
jgi:hypothetical protein